MPRFLPVLMLLALPAGVAAQTQTVTVRDIVALSRAGLGEEALIALIDVNRPVFPVDVDTLKGLKDAGVSQAVIVAMIRSGRTPPPEPPPQALPIESVAEPDEPAPPVPVVVVEHHERVREVPVAVPVYVAVPVRRDRGDHARPPSVRPKPAEPVYWGWGGKLRPDAWKPAAADVQKDAKVPLEPQRR